MDAERERAETAETHAIQLTARCMRLDAENLRERAEAAERERDEASELLEYAHQGQAALREENRRLRDALRDGCEIMEALCAEDADEVQVEWGVEWTRKHRVQSRREQREIERRSKR